METHEQTLEETTVDRLQPETEPVQQPDRECQPDPEEQPDPEKHTDGNGPDVETIVENAVAKALNGLEGVIKEAEERGYQRAVSEAKHQVEEMRRTEESRCNFLVSSRPDIWNS